MTPSESTPGGLARVDDALAAALRGACIAAFAVLIVLVTALILIRFLPVISLGWADEIVEMAFAWMTFLGAAALWRSRSHFRVDLIPSLLVGRRSGRILEIALSLMALIFFLVFTYEGIVFTLRSATPSAILALPKTYWYMSMPIAGVIIVGYTIRDLWRAFRGQATQAGEAAAEHHS